MARVMHSSSLLQVHPWSLAWLLFLAFLLQCILHCLLLSIFNKPQCCLLCPGLGVQLSFIIQDTKLGIAEVMGMPAHSPLSFLTTQIPTCMLTLECGKMWPMMSLVDDCGHRDHSESDFRPCA